MVSRTACAIRGTDAVFHLSLNMSRFARITLFPGFLVKNDRKVYLFFNFFRFSAFFF